MSAATPSARRVLRSTATISRHIPPRSINDNTVAAPTAPTPITPTFMIHHRLFPPCIFCSQRGDVPGAVSLTLCRASIGVSDRRRRRLGSQLPGSRPPGPDRDGPVRGPAPLPASHSADFIPHTVDAQADAKRRIDVRVAVIHYSATGSIHKLAQGAAEG